MKSILKILSLSLVISASVSLNAYADATINVKHCKAGSVDKTCIRATSHQKKKSDDSRAQLKSSIDKKADQKLNGDAEVKDSLGRHGRGTMARQQILQ